MARIGAVSTANSDCKVVSAQPRKVYVDPTQQLESREKKSTNLARDQRQVAINAREFVKERKQVKGRVYCAFCL